MNLWQQMGWFEKTVAVLVVVVFACLLGYGLLILPGTIIEIKSQYVR